MGKRKHEKTEEEIHRKILKLQSKLAKKSNDRDKPLQERLEDSPLETPYTDFQPYYCESELDTMQYLNVESPWPSYPPSVQPLSPRPNLSNPASHEMLPLAQPVTSMTLQSVALEDKTEEVELDDVTLQLLGDAPVAETTLGPPIHKDVARRWQDILSKGLTKYVKESLTKEYLVPSNCDLLLAPALNPEVKAALPDHLVKRDTTLLYKQKQLGVALSALATVTEMVLSNETSKQKILKPLSDACRLICDSHHGQSNTRRSFVISSINVKLKQTLIDSSRDQLLFGKNVSENLKAAKIIQQSSEALKNVQRTKFQRPNVPSTGGNKGHLNFVPQHRKMDTKPNFHRRAPNYSQRQAQNNSRRPSDRDRYRPSTSKTSAAVHQR